MTINVNLAGLPAIVVPCAHVPTAGGGVLPVGLQMVGRMFGEAALVQLAHVFEQTSSPLATVPARWSAAPVAAG